MNISDFRKKIDPIIVSRGEIYYKDGRILSVENNSGEFSAVILGNTKYKTSVTLSDNGEVEDSSCNCIYSYTSQYCKHVAALLFDIEEHYSEYCRGINSREIKNIIDQYCTLASAQAEEKIYVYPQIESSRDAQKPLKYSLKIGTQDGKVYAVKDVSALTERISFKRLFRYGKELEFVHDYRIFDEKSLKIIDFSHSVSCKTRYYSDHNKVFMLSNEDIEQFMNIFEDGEDILFDGNECKIKRKNPMYTVKISEKSDDCYDITLSNMIIIYSWSRNSCIFDRQENIFYITDSGYAQTVCNLLAYLQRSKTLRIAKKDMPAFYNAVIKPIGRYMTIDAETALDEYIPPGMSSKIYIDSVNDGVCAHFEFIYNDEIYPNFYDQSKNPFCEYSGEKSAENVILKYFDINDKDDEEPLYINGDRKLYELLAVGMNSIENSGIEVYLSDKFKKISVRQPVRPSVGVIPSGNLLELQITASGYTPEELSQILHEYRKGGRYYRFRDGTFTVFDEAVNEFAGMADSLNISDKALLKDRIKVPKYRMLYLDSLKKECENMSVRRTSEFKTAVRKYKSEIEDTDAPLISDKLDATMREYQKYGFQWLRTIAAYGFGGILADDMGLGKTIQAIALMLYAKQTRSEHTTNLVVCPSSLVLNWQCEIKRFAPDLTTAAVSGTAEERDSLLSQTDKYDVIITSYALITRDILKYSELSFHIHVVDEAQYIKNHNTQTAKAVKGIHSDIRFALTGTPVENSLAELWSIFDFVMPDFLFGYTYFKKNFENPIVGKDDKKVTAQLQKLISPFILRRMKKDVLTELPDKTQTVLYCSMEDEQSKLYSANVADIKKSISKGFTEQTDRIKILAMLTRLRQICCDPALVYGTNYKASSAKLELCLELVTSCINSGHKILLFSQFTSMLDIIKRRFDENNISSCMLTGKTKTDERVRLVNRFNADDTNVFLISLKAGGTGLNLTGADIVIHYDPWWNISAENQASDRAYRIGQKKNVQIYKLITGNTIEEKIMSLQESKAELYDIAVNGEGDIMRMSAEEILDIVN
ncbi:MAG: SNF2 helicase associated domain-containing protein [Oscillospiraceae bacterium]|nr:SNF2 helicase associated domain-containing protein [Oscillospiraceae bacterium]